jgi:hypothetical protein
VGVLSVGGPGVTIASADSGTCSPNGLSGHDYAEVCQSTDQEYHGVTGYVESSGSLYVPQPSTEWLSNEMWIVNPNGGDPRWIEAGLFFGTTCALPSGGCWTASHETRFFWGDKRSSCGCFYTHVDANDVVSLGSAYNDAIVRRDSSNWDVTIGPMTGTSTNNNLSPSRIRAGTETTAWDNGDLPTACNGQFNLQWEGASDNWHTTGWDDNGGPPSHQWDDPPFAAPTGGAKWMSQYSWAREWSNWSFNQCWPGGAADISLGPASHRGHHPAPRARSRRCAAARRCAHVRRNSAQGAGPSLTEPQIDQIALNAAAGLGGDPNPSSIKHVAGPRDQTVFALSGDQVNSNNSVYAIVMRGSFVADDSLVPSDASAPTGSVLVVVIDASTGELTDFGVQNQVPDLARLGPVTTDQ